MRRGRAFVFLAAAVAALAAAPAFAADVKCAWSSPTSDTQVAPKNVNVLLKGGVADAVDPLGPIPASYTWSFGDGTASVTTNITQTYGWWTNPANGNWEQTMVTTNFRGLTALHKYTKNGSYTATLKVFDGVDGTGNVLGQDSTTVVVGGASQLEIGVDDALWYLHTQLVPEGGDLVGWLDRNYDEGLVMIATTFLKEGYLASSTNTADPYIDDVRRLVNNVLANLFTVAEGVYYCVDNETTYGFGPALETLARSGYDANYSTPAGSLGEVVQDMVDWISWFQLGANGYDWNGCQITLATDKAPCPSKVDGGPSTAGGWPYLTEGWGCNGSTISKSFYDKGTYGDRSVSYWMVGGLNAAEERFNAVVPASVRTNLYNFLAANNPCAADNFGPTHGWNLIERAGQGLSLYKWLSKDPRYASLALNTDSRVAQCGKSISSWWRSHNYQHGQDHPDAAEQCSANSLDGKSTCYSHYKAGAWELGYWGYDATGNWVWITTGYTNDINVFAFKTVAEGVKKYPGLTTLPCANYPGLLATNQGLFQDGSIDDSGWVTGYLFGTAWGADALMNCR